jgi:hypothetical protein
MHDNVSGYCHQHSSEAMVTSYSAAPAASLATPSKQPASALASTPGAGRPSMHAQSHSRGISRNTSVGKLLSDDPTGAKNKHKNLSAHIKRISLRETAQELADDKDSEYEKSCVTMELIAEAKVMVAEYLQQQHEKRAQEEYERSQDPQQHPDGATSASSSSHSSEADEEALKRVDGYELGHLLHQFRALDLDKDNLITIFDLREHVKKVDPEWCLSPDNRLQNLLNEAIKDWLMSASVDGCDEINFIGMQYDSYVLPFIPACCDRYCCFGRIHQGSYSQAHGRDPQLRVP